MQMKQRSILEDTLSEQMLQNARKLQMESRKVVDNQINLHNPRSRR